MVHEREDLLRLMSARAGHEKDIWNTEQMHASRGPLDFVQRRSVFMLLQGIWPLAALAFAVGNEALKNRVQIVKVLLGHGADPSGVLGSKEAETLDPAMK